MMIPAASSSAQRPNFCDHFTGKERDAETGLDYFGARYMSSPQGRFTSPDWSSIPQPIPYADLRDPQTLNLYGYVRNNPLWRADLNGHGWLKDLWHGIVNSTYKPLATLVQHPILSARAIGFAAVHPIQTIQGIKSSVTVTVTGVVHGKGEDIGVALGTVGMFFIPGGEAGDAAEGVARAGEVAEAVADAAKAAEVADNLAKGLGAVSSGAATAERALSAAEEFLGAGYKEMAPGVFRSADNTRQFRITTSDLVDMKQGPHVHFESIGPDGRTIVENGHVNITNP
jgi:RHS repeat-associated protein